MDSRFVLLLLLFGFVLVVICGIRVLIEGLFRAISVEVSDIGVGFRDLMSSIRWVI